MSGGVYPDTTEPPIYTHGFTTTDLWIVIYYLGLFILSLIFISQILGILYNSARLKSENRQSYVSMKHSTKLILYPLFATYIFSIFGLSTAQNRLSNATQTLCNYTYALTFASFASVKVSNYFFFLQRAKLAQGLNPLFSDKTFNKILPSTLFIYWIILLTLIAIFPLKGDKVTSSRTGRELCILSQYQLTLMQYLGIGIQTVLDLFWTIFFLCIFGKPMLELQRHSTSRNSSKNQEITDNKVRRTIYINFLFSSLTSFHYILCILLFALNIDGWYAMLDYVFNSLCLFLMLASNRRFVIHALCCVDICAQCCVKPPTFLSRNQIKIELSKQITNSAHPTHPVMRSNATSDEFVNSNHLIPNSNHNKQIVPSTPSVTMSNMSPKSISLTIPDDSITTMRIIRFRSDLCCGGKDKHSNLITSKEWMMYLDNNWCCYYKSKLLWTWIYYMFCFCHCYIISLNFEKKNNKNKKSSSNKRIKSRSKTIKRMFLAADKLNLKKFYIGTDRAKSIDNTQNINYSNNNHSTSPKRIHTNSVKHSNHNNGFSDDEELDDPKTFNINNVGPSVTAFEDYQQKGIIDLPTPIPEDDNDNDTTQFGFPDTK